MERSAILKETFLVESKLLEVSKRVKNAEEFATIETWIRHLLKTDPNLAKHFVIPTERLLKKALLDLVTIESSLTKPVLNLLSTKIASYVVVIDDLRVHPMIGPVVQDILDNFQPLVELVRKHDFHVEHPKTIEMIRRALEDNRLHIYQSFPREPNIRIVLKTLQLDTSRTDRKSLQYLLKFLFDQLNQNLQQPGFISQPRHAWWALLDLVQESDIGQLHKMQSELNEILLSFLRAVEYIPKEADPASVVPEMNSVYNEEVWVTLNMMRLYRTCIHELVPHSTVEKLVAKIELNVRRISERNDDSIRSNQCKLLVLYEALAYLNHVDILKLCSVDQIDLRERFVGLYLYNDELLGHYREIKTTIQNLITSRQNWTKHILSSLLISGPPASGKTELIRQIIAEIGRVAHGKGRTFEHQFFTIGSEVNTEEDLRAIISKETSAQGSDGVRVVTFDEFEKAQFNFPAPFLKLLASETREEQPLTFWFFGQSSHATYYNLQLYADALKDKTLRDFLTRLELGKLDLSELKVSPQQKIFTALGYALSKHPQLEKVSRSCITYFGTNERLINNRQVISEFERKTILEDNRLSLVGEINNPRSEVADTETGWISIVK
ncbi:MAG TPA: hypothetical protein VJU86_01095 [Pyrinomonadaceae bacterium]|nr:hypothetical protein [Pyrinomonadaceae bacterium]